MPIPRSRLIDATITRHYHVISRCVRRLHLLADDPKSPCQNRKGWLERRLKELSEIFAISVSAYAFMDNHFHLLLRLDTDAAGVWTSEEVTRRWFRLFPPRGVDRKPIAEDQLEEVVLKRSLDPLWVAEIRARLQSISWFMRCLKEPLARLVNKADGRTGAFFEGRFKSIAVLDERALLTCMAYIDLNPVAAGVAGSPESASNTSLCARLEHVHRQRRTQDLGAATVSSIMASQNASKMEEALWLNPIEDRRKHGSFREGLIETFPLGCYLLLLDHVSRMRREGKASLESEAADILQRIGATSDSWCVQIRSLMSGRCLGRFLASERGTLRTVAQKIGVRRVANLNGCAG